MLLDLYYKNRIVSFSRNIRLNFLTSGVTINPLIWGLHIYYCFIHLGAGGLFEKKENPPSLVMENMVLFDVLLQY